MSRLSPVQKPDVGLDVMFAGTKLFRFGCIIMLLLWEGGICPVRWESVTCLKWILHSIWAIRTWFEQVCLFINTYHLCWSIFQFSPENMRNFGGWAQKGALMGHRTLQTFYKCEPTKSTSRLAPNVEGLSGFQALCFMFSVSHKVAWIQATLFDKNTVHGQTSNF